MAELVCGVLFALIVAVVSVLVRPRAVGALKPVDIMIKHAGVITVASALTPFARVGGQNGQKRRRESELSDDEELEKLQMEQGKAMIDRLVEANDFDPETSEMLRNVLKLSDTLTREIMVPRTDMICIGKEQTLVSMLKLCSRSGFSRVPVIGEDVDDLIGVATSRTPYAPRRSTRRPANAPSIRSCATPLLVPESKPVDDLFHQMQSGCASMRRSWWMSTAASPAW